MSPVFILSETNGVDVFPSHFLIIHFKVILSSKLRSSKLLLSLKFLHNNKALFFHPCVPYFRPFDSSARELLNNVWAKIKINSVPHLELCPISNISQEEFKFYISLDQVMKAQKLCHHDSLLILQNHSNFM
jgi:hypothetical protein